MIARPLSLVTTHRGITHSLAALAVVSIAAAFVLPMPIALLIGAGYASHLAADALTARGVPFFAPLSWRMIALARIAPGGGFERLIAMGAVAATFAMYMYPETPSAVESMRADIAAWIARLPTAIPLGIDLRLK
jgi:inner membrane protein